jgi:hypothetical protein
MYPTERGRFDSLAGFPQSPAVNQLCFVETVDRLGKSVVAAVAAAANRGFDPCLSESLCGADADVLGPTIGVVKERIAVGLSFAESLLQCVQNEVRWSMRCV